ncbi:hypothetical protein AMJ57_03065 [Parcubacteria bacterium SG8_24]|nr:MAG: hypothetical protein AMJ57_03065 [Parcubacteria bacterium SG8_24]
MVWKVRERAWRTGQDPRDSRIRKISTPCSCGRRMTADIRASEWFVDEVRCRSVGGCGSALKVPKRVWERALR